MAKFDLVTHASKEIRLQSDLLDQKYFTLDTADEQTIHGWNDYNRYAFTAAILDDKLCGFFTVLPISTEAAALIDRSSLREEDLSLEYVLPHESLKHAKYAYIPAIAIGNLNGYLYRQCAAALLVGMVDLFTNGYDPKVLQKIYANPTTYHGNRFSKRLGFKPMTTFKKSLTQSDPYVADFNEDFVKSGQEIAQPYRRFVGKNAWEK